MLRPGTKLKKWHPHLISLITLCAVDYIHLTFSNMNYIWYHYVRTLVYQKKYVTKNCVVSKRIKIKQLK